MNNALQFNRSVIGHRGACAYAPENTLASFTKAAQQGVKWVEFDIMQAASGELFVFHDDVLDRTSSGRGDPTQYSISYLQSLDAGGWFDLRFSGERIPSLTTVLDFLQDVNISANVELKCQPGHEARMVKRLLAEMRPYLKQANDRFLFSSFTFEALFALREAAPDCHIGLLLHEWEKNWESICASLNTVSVHVNEEIMSKEAAKKIKGMHKSLLCYTVNSPQRARELFSWGVDGVFSDAPDVLLADSHSCMCSLASA